MYESLMQDTPGIQTSYAMLAFTWLNLRILHLWLRYQSLSVLRFRTVRVLLLIFNFSWNVENSFFPNAEMANSRATVCSYT